MTIRATGHKIVRLFGLWLSVTLLFTSNSAFGQFNSNGASQLTVDSLGNAFSGTSVQPVAAPNSEIYAFLSDALHVDPDIGGSSPGMNVYLYTPDDGFTLASGALNTTFSSSTDFSSPAISPVLPNGLYGIAFVSGADDLTEPKISNGKRQVFLRIPGQDQTVRVSVNPDQNLPPTQRLAIEDCDEVSVTVLPNPDRFLVAFTSRAANLSSKFPDNPNNVSTAYMATVRLSETGTWYVASMDVAATSLDANNNPAVLDGDIVNPTIAGDGKSIIFSSTARLVPQIPTSFTERFLQVYRYVHKKEKPVLISKNKSGLPGNGDSKAPAVSFTGDTVAFITEATNFAGSAPAGSRRLIVKRAGFQGLRQANTAVDKTPSNGEPHVVFVHPSGKFISFSDSGTNLTDANTNETVQTYVKSLVSETIVRTSETGGGQAGDDASGLSQMGPALALTGRGFNSPELLSIFHSKSTNLTVSGSNPNNYSNIYLNELTPPKPKFEKKAPIEAPPDVALEPTQSGASGSKVTFTFQEFEDLNASTATDGTVSPAARSRLQYHLEIRKKTGNRRKRFRKSSRNSATIRRLAPGRYVVRYRVIKKSGRGSSSKVESKSRYSPRQTIDIS